ncbi:MAG: dihydrodipicolinate synthase family protein [Clostridia bacterium]|nr:dihydrodipicolinate synthase family protein [Clostridia bacterium]
MKGGIYPTMITPYKDGKIDFDGVNKLVDWYCENGCDGIFAVCQSSEMWYMGLDERVELAKAVLKAADGRLDIVASGHVSNSIEDQINEINAIGRTGVKAMVLVSNRFDPHNDGDDVWIANAERVLAGVDKDINLGMYECPIPYKRLLSPKIIDWCVKSGRFKFIKDTCCDPDLLKERAEQLKGTGFMLFNANGQTFLHSLKCGADGYSGIMANFHPELYSWVYKNFKAQPERAEELSNALSMMAFTESPSYPCTAKYHQNKYAVPMSIESRSCDSKKLTSYQKYIVDQMHGLQMKLRSEYGI